MYYKLNLFSKEEGEQATADSERSNRYSYYKDLRVTRQRRRKNIKLKLSKSEILNRERDSKQFSRRLKILELRK